jgi:hypothetical protein
MIPQNHPLDSLKTLITKCVVCDDTGWVCETHPDRPTGMFSKRFDACNCGAAGMPCATCNPCDADNPPDMSRTGLKIAIDTKTGSRH